MRKNIVTIFFLLSLIFVTLMFGEDVEGFDLPYDQTDPNGPSGKKNGTYFTKETDVNGEKVSVFSALRDFSKAISNAAIGPNGNSGYNGVLKTCLDPSLRLSNVEKQNCIDTYKTNMNMASSDLNFWENSGPAKKLQNAVNANTLPPINGKKDPNDIRVSEAEYKSTKSTISNTYKENKENRNVLDIKMSELINNSGMKTESSKKQTSTMYVNILLTVLAATALYYIFIKI